MVEETGNRTEVMFGQSSDYNHEANLEQRAMQLTQNLEYYISKNVNKTPPQLRAEAIALIKGMRVFLFKYPTNIDEFGKMLRELEDNEFDIYTVNDVIDRASMLFSQLAGKQLKFRARSNEIPKSEYHFLSTGYKSNQQQQTGND